MAEPKTVAAENDVERVQARVRELEHERKHLLAVIEILEEISGTLHFVDILQVKPGVTGLSQLAFAEESRILDDDDPTGHYIRRILPQKMGMDRVYARNFRLRLDVSILIWTLIAVLARREVAVHRSTGSMNLRRRRRPSEAVLPSSPAAAAPALALAPAGQSGVVLAEVEDRSEKTSNVA